MSYKEFVPAITNNLIQSFYQQHGIKQYNSFSGGFKYLSKQSKPTQNELPPNPKKDLYEEFGLSRTNKESYKLDHNNVPDTKLELADMLMQKLEHKMNKMNYYRQKYYQDQINHHPKR